LNRLRKPLLSLAVLLVAALAAELLNRAWLSMHGDPYDSASLVAQLEALADPSREFTPAGTSEGGPERPILHPYTGSENEHDTGGVLEFFRKLGDAPPEPGAPGPFVVVVVGGSVAVRFADEPRLLEGLQAQPRLADRRVVVLNYAHATYKQPQQLMRLAYLFSLGYRPDAVINLDGFNEIAMSLQCLSTGIHPVYPAYLMWGMLVEDVDNLSEAEMDRRVALFQLRQRADAIVRRTKDWNLQWSSLLGGLARSQLRAVAAQRVAIQSLDDEQPARRVDRQAQGPDFRPGLEFVLGTCVTNWVESSLSIQGLCEQRGIPYLHVLQPTLHDAGAKKLSQEERDLPLPNRGWLTAARQGYPLLREAGSKLVAGGVEFRDASRVFADVRQTLFIDACHLNREGNRRLAAYVVDWLMDALP